MNVLLFSLCDYFLSNVLEKLQSLNFQLLHFAEFYDALSTHIKKSCITKQAVFTDFRRYISAHYLANAMKSESSKIGSSNEETSKNV